MIQKISKLTLEKYDPDLLIEIPVTSFRTFEFYKSKEIIEAGRLAAIKSLNELKL